MPYLVVLIKEYVPASTAKISLQLTILTFQALQRNKNGLRCTSEVNETARQQCSKKNHLRMLQPDFIALRQHPGFSAPCVADLPSTTQLPFSAPFYRYWVSSGVVRTAYPCRLPLSFLLKVHLEMPESDVILWTLTGEIQLY